MLTLLKRTVRDQPLLRAGALRAGSLVRALSAAPPGLYTLCFHHVTPAARANFSAQLDVLRRHGTFVSADEATAFVGQGRAAEERRFLLTFDDGYLDNLEVALPVMREHGVPAILFLVSDWLDTPPKDGQFYMNRDAVLRWLRAGLDIGSHGASHRRFSRLSAEDAAREMHRSAAALGSLAGRAIEHFAFPWGVADEDFLPARDVSLARAAGYRTLFTTRRGHATEPGDLALMPRHVLEPEWPAYQLHGLMGGRIRARR